MGGSRRWRERVARVARRARLAWALGWRHYHPRVEERQALVERAAAGAASWRDQVHAGEVYHRSVLATEVTEGSPRAASAEPERPRP